MSKSSKSKPGARGTRPPGGASPSPSSSAGQTPPVVRAAGPPAEAVRLFDLAVRALQAHDYRTASARLKDLLTSFEDQRALSDRARVYLALCDRELAKAPAAPETIEDRLIAATAALNRGADQEAERLAKDVALDDDRQDLAFYILAAVDARRGSVQAALANLARAIQIRPDLAAQALHDEDFTRLRDLEAFRDLTHPASPGGRRSHEPPRGR